MQISNPFIHAEDTILALLAHPGDQELLLGKLAVKSFDFPAACHAHALLHLRDPVRKKQISRSWLDAGRVWDREVVVHAISQIDFYRLRREFENIPHNNTTVNNLKDAIEKRLDRMIQQKIFLNI